MLPLALGVLGAAGALAARRAYHSVHNTRAVTGAHSRESYRVHRAFGDQRAAAALLERTHLRLIAVLAHIRRHHRGHPVADTLLARFNPSRLVENSPHNPGHTAYTENKGETVALCLRDGAHPHALVDADLLLFVALHELAHVGSRVQGHPPKYWANFRWLLRAAAASGAYRPADYGRRPQYYCGELIDHNPFFDAA